MGLLVPSALPVLWVLGCFSLLLWLWALCTACHRKQARRHGSVMPVEMVSARLPQGQSRTSRGPTSIPCPQSYRSRTCLCSLSKSDTRLHELHRGKHYGTAPRPTSMDLRPLWLEMSRGSTRLQAASSTFLPQQRPRVPPAITATATLVPIGPEATYSNVGLATVPRASLEASPVVWEGTQLVSCNRPGSRTRTTVAKYACIQKCKGPQELQGGAEVTPLAQDILYAKICKPKHKNPEFSVFPPDPQSQGVVPALRSGLAHEDVPSQDLGMDEGPLENVYESIQEMGV